MLDGNPVSLHRNPPVEEGIPELHEQVLCIVAPAEMQVGPGLKACPAVDQGIPDLGNRKGVGPEIGCGIGEVLCPAAVPVPAMPDVPPAVVVILSPGKGSRQQQGQEEDMPY